MGYRKPNSNQFDVVETKIDSTGTHEKKYVVDSVDEPEIMDRSAPIIKENNLKAYEPSAGSSDIITPEFSRPEVVDAKPPVKAKPVKPKPVKDIIVEGPIGINPLIDTDLINSKPVAVKPISTKPPKAKPTDTKPVTTKAPTKKPKPIKDIIVDGKPDVIDKPQAVKPISTKAPIKKPVKDTIVDTKPVSTKAPKKPKPIKDTIVDGKPDAIDKPPVVKPPTKKPVKIKPAKPAKPAKPVKPAPVNAENDIKAPNQGPFPGLTFLWSLYRRPVVTVVGAFLNRPETGLNWIPFIANAPTLPPWPPKLPWERFPIVG